MPPHALREVPAVKDKKKSHQPDRYAAALDYEPGQEGAPRVTAAGRGETARTISDLAAEHGVPVYHDAELAKTLYRLGVNTEIPPELYEAVARILVCVAEIDRKIP